MYCINIIFPEAVICGPYITGDHKQYSTKDRSSKVRTFTAFTDCTTPRIREKVAQLCVII
jgi:hypothetical protein